MHCILQRTVDIKVKQTREAVHVLRAVSHLRGNQQENKNTVVRTGGRRGQQVLAEICARQISNCNCLQRSHTSSNRSSCRLWLYFPGAPLLPNVTPPPQRPMRRQSEKTYDVSVHTLARSASPSVRTATTTDTNWFSCCHAAEVTRTTWAQMRRHPLPAPLRSQRGALVGTVCVHSWYRHDVCDACSVNKEHHYLELSSLRHSLQETGGEKTTTSLNQILLVGAPPQSRLSGTLQGNLKHYQLQLQSPYPPSAWKNNN